MDFTEFHDEAEANKVLIDVINDNPQHYIDMCFLDKVITEIDAWFDEYLKEHIADNAKRGYTEVTIHFTLTNRYLNDRSFGPGLESTIFNPFEFIKLTNFYIDNSQVRHSNITNQSYTVSLEGLKNSYEYWVNEFKKHDIKITHIDEFDLTKNEYKKLLKSWFKFERNFTVTFSF